MSAIPLCENVSYLLRILVTLNGFVSRYHGTGSNLDLYLPFFITRIYNDILSSSYTCCILYMSCQNLINISSPQDILQLEKQTNSTSR